MNIALSIAYYIFYFYSTVAAEKNLVLLHHSIVDKYTLKVTIHKANLT